MITSRDNSRLKHARQVRDGRVRDSIFVEGLRLAEEAAANLQIAEYFFTADFAEATRGRELLSILGNKNVHGAQVSETLLAGISDTKTPQGIVIIAQRPTTGRELLAAKLRQVIENQLAALIVVLHRLSNPNNVGAILRTAEAAGAKGVVLTKNTADVFSAKSLRAAMGSAFRLPLWTNADFLETIEFCRENNLQTVSADVDATKSHFELDWRQPLALVVGAEADGLTPEEIAQTDERLRIPMHSPVESLNVAVACGVVLYEAVRQRVEISENG